MQSELVAYLGMFNSAPGRETGLSGVVPRSGSAKNKATPELIVSPVSRAPKPGPGADRSWNGAQTKHPLLSCFSAEHHYPHGVNPTYILL